MGMSTLDLIKIGSSLSGMVAVMVSDQWNGDSLFFKNKNSELKFGFFYKS